MRLNELGSFNFPELAAWPQPRYGGKYWHMYILKLREDETLHWYPRYIEKDGNENSIIADMYDSYSSATEAADKLNNEFLSNIDSLSLEEFKKASLRLKVEKALTAKTRLTNEEQLMLEEGIKKNAQVPRLKQEELIIDTEITSSELKSLIFNVLNEMPYLHFIHISRHGYSLLLKEDGSWARVQCSTSKAEKFFYRECIARGFGLSGFEHWGKTKSAIRAMLLPRANELLQLASVKRMLSEALSKGQKVLLVDGFVFWFEDHNQVGWTVKEASDSGAGAKGNTLWKEGTIISKNHGRIVVLPYIKENGDYVQGHTKNAPNDGKALPRHRDEYVELPFEVLNGDVMRGLFGELYYE
ncbi:hypothetical protein [Pantoea ananatis]|jgi:hypothetical protein|uniref:hypothetical protein n=1 Tax=Pantoea ananas TaxID=553 RepID=UPI000CF51875|nr:hypothetical protein [Pantoea ananatis]MCH9271795.1 hypothetical protein [Pantoea ananatis]PQK87864.1 hypothetical protein CG433_22115 [Pantoea ananatis]